jgi:hypothetical protein
MHTGRPDQFLGSNKENKDHSVDHHAVESARLRFKIMRDTYKKGAAKLRRLSFVVL